MIDNSFGQTLLELVVALGLIGVSITAITILNINGLQNSQFSQNQLQATKLAQEGMDLVRVIREQDYTVCAPLNNNTDLFSKIWDPAFTCPAVSSGCNFNIVKAAGTCNLTLPITTTNLWLNLTSNNEILNGFGVRFKRNVTIIDILPNQKEVKVTVKWTDTSGTHVSNVSTVMTPNP